VELELREGGIRNLKLDEQAALIYCPFRALLHPADLGRPAQHLRTGRRIAPSRRTVRVERLQV
jgi:hypothetical protein